MNENERKTVTTALEHMVVLAAHATSLVEEHNGTEAANAELGKVLGFLANHARHIDEAFQLHVGASRLLRERAALPRPKLLSTAKRRGT